MADGELSDVGWKVGEADAVEERVGPARIINHQLGVIEEEGSHPLVE